MRGIEQEQPFYYSSESETKLMFFLNSLICHENKPTFRLASPTVQKFLEYYWRRRTVLGDLFDIGNVRWVHQPDRHKLNVKVGFDIRK